MFVAILRRWRLATPVVLAMLAVAVVAGGLLGQTASAHSVKFHFFGRAYALADDTTVIPDTTCDSGFLPITGGVVAPSSDGHLGCGGPEFQGEPGAGTTGSGRLEASLEATRVIGTHSAHKGSVLSVVDMEEPMGAHQVNTEGCEPIPNPRNCVADSPQQVNGHPVISILGDCPHVAQIDCLSVAQVSDVLFWADLIRVEALAECHTTSSGATNADVKAATVQLSNAAVREDNGLHYIGPQGSVGPAGNTNTTFTISGFTFPRTQLIIRDIVVIINEQKQFEEGDLAAITVNAIHLIGTDDDGLVKFNFVLAHAFAGIHCANHLPSEDTLTIPGA